MIEKVTTARKKLSQQKLDALLKSTRTQALLISSSYNIGYLTGFFGFSKIEREGYVLITKNHMYFFASGLNSEAVQKHIHRLALHLKGVKVKLVTISPRSPLTKKVLADIIRKEKIKRLGFEKHSLLFSEYERLQKDLTVSLTPTEHFVEELRMVKTADEIGAIEKACKLADEAFDYILKRIKPKVTEKELATEIEFFIRKAGAEISFPPIIAFGPNSSIPHHVTSDQRLTHSPSSGQATIILLDFGVRINNYCSDMTRTVFFGKASTEQRRMYQTVLESQKKAIVYLSNHLGRWRGNDLDSSEVDALKAKDVDRVARSHITSQGFSTIPHSLGHGIGLEVHEPPNLSPKSKAVLKPGMVFSVEPGIYIPKFGGVRIEDLVVLEKNGPRLLIKAKRALIEV